MLKIVRSHIYEHNTRQLCNLVKKYTYMYTFSSKNSKNPWGFGKQFDYIFKH